MNKGSGTVLAGSDQNRRRRMRLFVTGVVTLGGAVAVALATPAMQAAAGSVVPQGVGGWDSVCVGVSTVVPNGVGGWDTVCIRFNVSADGRTD